ncbi:hypothetical protein D3C73_1227560 [compost metagenome]
MDMLLTRAAEQDQRQFGGRQGVGAGVVALEHFQLEPVDPLVQTGFADVGLGTQQRGDIRHIQESMLQLVAQVIFQCASQHVLVERRMKGQHRAVADKLHELQ